MSGERLYLVTYDIADVKRWRAVFKLMNGFGEWQQLSVFQCRLTSAREAELLSLLSEVISVAEDHVLIVDIGSADQTAPKIRSLGKRGFAALERTPLIV